MSSNLGSREIASVASSKLGFARNTKSADDQMIYRTALDAAKKHFTPEFMNRIDKSIVFRNLTPDALLKILKLEVDVVRMRFASMGLTFHLTSPAERLLLEEGQESRYGARHIKRAIERLLTSGLTAIVLSGQVPYGVTITVDADSDGKLAFLIPNTGFTLV